MKTAAIVLLGLAALCAGVFTVLTGIHMQSLFLEGLGDVMGLDAFGLVIVAAVCDV